MELKTLKDLEIQILTRTGVRLNCIRPHLLKAEAIKWVKKEGMIITADEWNAFFNITEEELKCA